MARVNRILVPVDGSETSFKALDFAVSLARQLSARLDVITVLDMGSLDFYDGIYLTPEQVQRREEHIRQSVLDKARTRIPEDLTDVGLEVLTGPVVKTVLDHIDETAASLLVIGRTGKGALRAALGGSTTHALVHRCEIPVTVVG